jgi:hypothetical protein
VTDMILLEGWRIVHLQSFATWDEALEAGGLSD